MSNFKHSITVRVRVRVRFRVRVRVRFRVRFRVRVRVRVRFTVSKKNIWRHLLNNKLLLLVGWLVGLAWLLAWLHDDSHVSRNPASIGKFSKRKCAMTSSLLLQNIPLILGLEYNIVTYCKITV